MPEKPTSSTHVFRFIPPDLRADRPAGWLDAGLAQLELLRPMAARHGVTLLQLACAWNLRQPGVQCVAPMLLEEPNGGTKAIERQLEELAAVALIPLSDAELVQIQMTSENSPRGEWQGAWRGHRGFPTATRWGLNSDLEAVAQRWQIDPASF